ncbi:MAG: hypothetical protein IANPNBLG_00783 [Bryobacteraceae bacterium]|nr:hypothetical protein [Bryobacteraceae bacterium]
MPVYRIFRMKETERQRFRNAPHTSGVMMAKPKDYLEEGTVDAPTLYSAWTLLKDTRDPLAVGDILGCPDGDLRILKYIGFEEARWIIPEVKSGLENVPPAAGPVVIEARTTTA